MLTFFSLEIPITHTGFVILIKYRFIPVYHYTPVQPVLCYRSPNSRFLRSQNLVENEKPISHEIEKNERVRSKFEISSV